MRELIGKGRVLSAWGLCDLLLVLPRHGRCPKESLSFEQFCRFLGDPLPFFQLGTIVSSAPVRLAIQLLPGQKLDLLVDEEGSVRLALGLGLGDSKDTEHASDFFISLSAQRRPELRDGAFVRFIVIRTFNMRPTLFTTI